MKKLFIAAITLLLPITVQAAAQELEIPSSRQSTIDPYLSPVRLGEALEVGDLDGDSHADFIISAESGYFYGGGVHVVYGDGQEIGDLSMTENSILISGVTESEHLGAAVHIADLNGDGDNDLLIGAPNNDDAGLDAGAIYILYGDGSRLTEMTIENAVQLTGVTGDDIGSTIESGDFNNDGYQDVLIAADDSMYIVYGQSSELTSGSLSSYVQIAPESVGDLNFISFDTGYINGDDYEDIIIGAVGDDDAGTNAGAAYVLYGQEANFSSGTVSTSYKFTGEAAGDAAGSSVAAADVNDDGIDDLIIGAATEDTAGTNAGAIYIVFGAGDEVVSGSLSAADVFITGEAAGDQAGHTIHCGDVDGDGVDDCVIGASSNDDGGTNQGSLYVVLGDAAIADSSLSTAAAQIANDYSSTPLGRNPFSVADMNADGRADILFGDTGGSTYGPFSGIAFAYYGASSLSSINVSDIENFAHFDYRRIQAGYSDTVFADVNGDGFNDMLVLGTEYYFIDSVYPLGVVSIMYGDGEQLSASSISESSAILYKNNDGLQLEHISSGDMNADGFDDILLMGNSSANLVYGRSAELTTQSTEAFAEITDINADAYDYSLFQDLDSDGFDDLLIYDQDGVHIFYGSSTQLSDISIDSADASLTYAGLASGEQAITAGDINGDGYADIIVGHASDSDAGTSAGAISIVYGSSTRFSGAEITDIAVKIAGEAANDSLANLGALTAGDINNDGYDDIIVGARGNDEQATNAGATYIIYGQSSTLSAGSISEHVRITGTAANEDFGSRWPAIADVNNDGVNDLILGSDNYNSQAGAIAFFMGESGTTLTSGTWLERADYYILGENGAGVNLAFGDIDGNGYDDMHYVELYENGGYGQNVIVYFGGADFTVSGSSATVECTASYTDAGATAVDFFTEDSLSVVTTNPVDTDTPGSYTVTYTAAANIFGAQGTTTRSVTVVDTTDPTLALVGDSTVTLTAGDPYTEQGATASDDCDSSLTIATSGTVDTETAGTYTVTYTTEDDEGNGASITRTVVVEAADVEEETTVTVTGVTALTNSRVRVTYSDGTTRTIRAFAQGSQKPRVKLTNDGERVVVLKRNGKNVRVFDAFTGEQLRGKKIRTKSQDRAYLKLLRKNGKEYVVVVTKRSHTIRTTLMRLTPATSKLLNKNTKRMTYLKANFRVQIRNSRVVIKKRNGTVKRVYKITRRHKLKKHR